MLSDAQGVDAARSVFDMSSPDKRIHARQQRGRERLGRDRHFAAKSKRETLLEHVQQQLAETPVFPTANNIGGKVASDTETTAYYALFVSNMLVALYIWIRFQNLDLRPGGDRGTDSRRVHCRGRIGAQLLAGRAAGFLAGRSV